MNANIFERLPNILKLSQLAQQLLNSISVYDKIKNADDDMYLDFIYAFDDMYDSNLFAAQNFNDDKYVKLLNVCKSAYDYDILTTSYTDRYKGYDILIQYDNKDYSPESDVKNMPIHSDKFIMIQKINVNLPKLIDTFIDKYPANISDIPQEFFQKNNQISWLIMNSFMKLQV